MLKILEQYTYDNGNLYYKGIKKSTRLHKGYLCIRVGRKDISLARAIYLWHYKEIPEGYYIDHIDGDPKNNIIENLRAVTPSENACNRNIHRKGRLPGAQKMGNRYYTKVTLALHIEFGSEATEELAHDNYMFVQRHIKLGDRNPSSLKRKLAKYKKWRDNI